MQALDEEIARLIDEVMEVQIEAETMMVADNVIDGLETATRFLEGSLRHYKSALEKSSNG